MLSQYLGGKDYYSITGINIDTNNVNISFNSTLGLIESQDGYGLCGKTTDNIEKLIYLVYNFRGEINYFEAELPLTENTSFQANY